jgi:hypothetical protein
MLDPTKTSLSIKPSTPRRDFPRFSHASLRWANKIQPSALSQFEFRVPLAPPVLRNGRFSHSRALAKPVAPNPKNKL